MKKNFIILIFLSILFLTKTHSAGELQIYANSLEYDSNKNLVAKGSVKLFSYNPYGEDEIIATSIAIINEDKKTIILPKEFEFCNNLI